MPDSFFDTNILIYVTAPLETAKSQRARAILFEGGTISVQVLNEVANVARQKLRMEWSEIGGLLTELRAGLAVVPLTLSTHERGVALAARHQLHIYDALIAAAALEAGCNVLYTEDMHHGLVLDDRLTVVNPFA
jgi:predicted nucleic acid-binding protein